MRIALRPSGGRGDYELAGSYNALSAADLFEKRFFYQVTPRIAIDGKAVAHRLAGKPRIRPVEDGEHPYRVISGILLLPAPRRELLRTQADHISLRIGAYAVAGIDLDVVAVEARRVLFAPKMVWAKSRGGLLKLDYAERMGSITTLWSAAEYAKSKIGALLRDHCRKVAAGHHGDILESAKVIQKYYQTPSDTLPLILADFGLVDSLATATVIGASGSGDDFEKQVDDDSPPERASKERIQKWRLQADRGPGAREFSIDVRQAYDFRCLFSGERLPKLAVLGSAGVDGAHILPWSTHGLNSIDNGLCLCKSCHWAFDSGLLQLSFDEKVGGYTLSIPEAIQTAAKASNFDMGQYLVLTGRIDKDRLPRNAKHWPSAHHLKELNSLI